MSSRASRRYGLSRRDVIKSAEGAAAAVGPFFHVTPTHAAIDETLNTWVINTMFAESCRRRRDSGGCPQARGNEDERRSGRNGKIKR